MAATATHKKPVTRHTTPRTLREAYHGDDGPALRIDREKHVVYGVKVLGRYSPNSHGHAQATGGTEYTPACMKDALRLYEGVEVMGGHDKKNNPDDRPDDDMVGVLRNVRMDGDCVRADLHYRPNHKLSERLLEDIERQFGKLGLSHDAQAAKERFDPVGRRLVIEKLQSVASVDLVRKPATNRNLWESQDRTMKTVRELIESLKLVPTNLKLHKRLFESDDMAPAMEAEIPAGGESDLKAALMAALTPLLDEAFESGDGSKAAAALKDFIKLHAKHAGGEVVTEADDKELMEGDYQDDKDKDKKTDDTKQEAVELAALRAEKGVRKLCESLQFTPTEVQLEALCGVSEGSRRKLVESFKAAKPAGTRPTSGSPAGVRPTPSALPTDAKSFAASLRD